MSEACDMTVWIRLQQNRVGSRLNLAGSSIVMWIQAAGGRFLSLETRAFVPSVQQLEAEEHAFASVRKMNWKFRRRVDQGMSEMASDVMHV